LLFLLAAALPLAAQVADNDPASPAAARIFKPGAALAYEYLVFNAQSDAARKATWKFRPGFTAMENWSTRVSRWSHR
jgi:hypothetical protein